MRSIGLRFFASTLACTALILGTPEALAHARPKVMAPAPDSTVNSPSTVTVTFSEAVEPKFSSLEVVDGQGKKYNTAHSAPASGDAKTLTLAMPPLHSGVYQVHWVSVAADGHRMEGEYKFTVK